MKWVGVAAATIFFLSFSLRSDQDLTKKDKLSDYGFFTGDIRKLDPADDVLPYSLNSALFSNYAEKLRFIKVPAGKKIKYNDSLVFDFPVGTVLIKNFYYPNDFRRPARMQ